MSLQRTAGLVTGLALLLALADMPSGYYRFLRVLVTTCAVFLAFWTWSRGRNLLALALGVAAILFNPIIPIYLYRRSTWAPLDIGFAILFLAVALGAGSDKRDKHPTP